MEQQTSHSEEETTFLHYATPLSDSDRWGIGEFRRVQSTVHQALESKAIFTSKRGLKARIPSDSNGAKIHYGHNATAIKPSHARIPGEPTANVCFSVRGGSPAEQRQLLIDLISEMDAMTEEKEQKPLTLVHIDHRYCP